jgi:transcriptional regulator with XRE-family HTH domain
MLYFNGTPDARINNALRQLREDRVMTQREVAEGAGITITALSRIENGRERPNFTTIRSLAKVFGLSPQEMRRIILSGQLILPDRTLGGSR